MSWSTILWSTIEIFEVLVDMEQEIEFYRTLGALTKRKEEWKEHIPYVASLVENQPLKITGKALWLLGEMGLNHPEEIEPYIGQTRLTRWQ